MQWKSRYTKADYANGSTRLKRRFAWLPVYISGTYVWLEGYEILQVFVVTRQVAVIDEEEKSFNLSKWVDLSKRICK